SGGVSTSSTATAPVEALNGIALDAQGAAAGDEPSLAPVQKKLENLRSAAASESPASFAKDPRFAQLINNAGVVLQARAALADAGSAGAEVRELVPKLLAEVGTLASGLSG